MGQTEELRVLYELLLVWDTFFERATDEMSQSEEWIKLKGSKLFLGSGNSFYSKWLYSFQNFFNCETKAGKLQLHLVIYAKPKWIFHAGAWSLAFLYFLPIPRKPPQYIFHFCFVSIIRLMIGIVCGQGMSRSNWRVKRRAFGHERN